MSEAQWILLWSSLLVTVVNKASVDVNTIVRQIWRIMVWEVGKRKRRCEWGIDCSLPVTNRPDGYLLLRMKLWRDWRAFADVNTIANKAEGGSCERLGRGGRGWRGGRRVNDCSVPLSRPDCDENSGCVVKVARKKKIICGSKHIGKQARRRLRWETGKRSRNRFGDWL